MDLEEYANNLIKALKNKNRVQIFNYLYLYNELTLKEIADHLGISKATVSRHMRVLEEIDIVDVYTKEDDVHPGRIPRQYYALAETVTEIEALKQTQKKLIKEDMDLFEPHVLRDILSINLSFIELLDQLVQLSLDKLQKLQNKEEEFDITKYNKLIIPEFANFKYLLFSKHQFKEFKQIYANFLSEVAKLFDEDAYTQYPKETMYMASMLPVKNILEL